MTTDPVSNMLTKIRNALLVGNKSVTIPYSKFKESIINVLKNENYISNFEIKKIDNKQIIIAELRFINNKPMITHIKKISKPGLKVYTSYKNIPRPLQGTGLIILSSPYGVISGKEAYIKKTGGELICEVY